MKQIIPFKKELLFKTKVSEITSISLEHTLSLINNDSISGEFHITGDYKMTTSSINREKFDYNLPFDIELDSRYDPSSITIDIDNFYYELVNNDSLQVNIDVYIEGTSIKEEPKTIEMEPDIIKEEIPKEPVIEDEEIIITPKEENRSKEVNTDIEITPNITITDTINNKEENNSHNEFNIFENIDNSDTYVTYHIYIVKEDDNIDKIINQFGVTKEDISLYNNLEDIKKGTKLIIPSINE